MNGFWQTLTEGWDRTIDIGHDMMFFFVHKKKHENLHRLYCNHLLRCLQLLIHIFWNPSPRSRILCLVFIVMLFGNEPILKPGWKQINTAKFALDWSKTQLKLLHCIRYKQIFAGINVGKCFPKAVAIGSIKQIVLDLFILTSNSYNYSVIKRAVSCAS